MIQGLRENYVWARGHNPGSAYTLSGLSPAERSSRTRALPRRHLSKALHTKGLTYRCMLRRLCEATDDRPRRLRAAEKRGIEGISRPSPLSLHHSH